VAIRRNQLDQELQEVIEERTSVWGITVLSVEIRDIVIPAELQEVMSAEAQAEREKNARMVLAEVEKDISAMLVDAANVYEENDLAVRLRTMHLLYESVKGSGGTVVVPSAYSEGFSDAALDKAIDSLKRGK
jgi:regulator of protease activity HflC (stomatin/prohibitin superfamily)